MAVLLLAALFLFLLSPLQAQHGQDCSKDRACGIHQTCYVGYCICELGYVRATKNCFPVRTYGESCFYDEQCVDHRMSCQEENNTTEKTCRCDKLHEWNEESKDCIQTMNISVLLNTLVENSEKDTSDVIMQEANTIFISLGWAGIAVAVILFLLAVGLIVYGCCLYECYDRCTKETQMPTRCPPTCVNYKREELSSVT